MINDHAGRAAPRSNSRFVFAAVVAAATFAPGLHAQAGEANAQVEDPFHVMAGARIEYYGHLSPGASIQLIWDTPGARGSWLGAQLHAQVVRFDSHPDATNPDRIRRDYHFAGRVKAGFGRGDGPLFYGFAEAGVGMIGTEPEAKRGDTYLLSGVGAGAGITLLPITFAVEGALGRADRPSSNLLDSFVMTLLYHFP